MLSMNFYCEENDTGSGHMKVFQTVYDTIHRNGNGYLDDAKVVQMIRNTIANAVYEVVVRKSFTHYSKIFENHC